MHENTPNEVEGTELDDRDVRALTEYMSVLDEGGDIYTVVGQNGGTYTVDVREGRCDCPDAEYNLPTDDGRERCKHVARVEFATGERAIPSWTDRDAIDEQLGAHVDAEPQVVAADGGLLEARGEQRALDTEAVGDGVDAAGYLVWRDPDDELGRELVGFAAVRDWAAIRDELARRGVGAGAIHHLETFDTLAEVGGRGAL